MEEYNMQRKIKNTKLKEIRIASKLTQDDVANSLGITRSSYQHLEAKGNLTGDILFRLSKLFSRPMEDFIEDPEVSIRRLRDSSTPIFTSSEPKSEPNLSDVEREVLSYVSKLNDVGLARALGYLQGLSGNDFFTKTNDDGLK